MAFTPGEVVSQRHLGRLLAAAFDCVVTIDPHLHRVATMDEVVPGRRGVALTAAPLLGAWIASHEPGALLVAPDAEAEQWVALPRRRRAWTTWCRTSSGTATMTCRSACRTPGCKAARVVLLDDVASTGRTTAGCRHHAAGARRGQRGRGGDARPLRGRCGPTGCPCRLRACATSGAPTACPTPATASAWRPCWRHARAARLGLIRPCPGWPPRRRPWPQPRRRPGSSS